MLTAPSGDEVKTSGEAKGRAGTALPPASLLRPLSPDTGNAGEDTGLKRRGRGEEGDRNIFQRQFVTLLLRRRRSIGLRVIGKDRVVSLLPVIPRR